MIDASTVVWFEEGGTEAAAPGPSDDARRALEEWGRARGVALAAASEQKARAVAIDWGAGDRVEEGLARARDALVGLDLEEAERALAGAELLLRAHPELPQAAWLRAEVERTWAARWLREPHGTKENEERAARAWRRAAALDGGRAAGLGERAFPSDAQDRRISATIELAGDARGATVRVDGERTLPGPFTRGAGEHAITVARDDGAVTWAAWVPVEEGAVLRLVAPATPACSHDDLGRAHLSGDGVDAGGARCPRWVAAVASVSGAIRVATCEGSTCGPLVEWRARFGPETALPVEPPHAEGAQGLPTWATWTLAGVAVAGTAVAAVLATSALKPAPTETRFVNGGVQIHAF